MEEGEKPVYIISEEGMELQGAPKPVPAAPEKTQYLLGSPLLSFSLFLALLSYFLDAGAWLKTAEGYIEKKQRAAALEPFRLWAERHPLAYDEVAANSAGLSGKAVLWEISRREGVYYYQTDLGKKISFANAGSPELAKIQESGSPAQTLGRVTLSENEVPLLDLLEVF